MTNLGKVSEMTMGFGGQALDTNFTPKELV